MWSIKKSWLNSPVLDQLLQFPQIIRRHISSRVTCERKIISFEFSLRIKLYLLRKSKTMYLLWPSTTLSTQSSFILRLAWRVGYVCTVYSHYIRIIPLNIAVGDLWCIHKLQYSMDSNAAMLMPLLLGSLAINTNTNIHSSMQYNLMEHMTSSRFSMCMFLFQFLTIWSRGVCVYTRCAQFSWMDCFFFLLSTIIFHIMYWICCWSHSTHEYPHIYTHISQLWADRDGFMCRKLRWTTIGSTIFWITYG